MRPPFYARANLNGALDTSPKGPGTPFDLPAAGAVALVADTNVYINNVAGRLPAAVGALLDRAILFHCSVCVSEIAALAKAETSDEVAAAYAGQELKFGPDYIIPKPFDSRLILRIAPAVAKAAADSGVGSNNLAVAAQDVFVLNFTSTTFGSGTANATATMLFDGDGNAGFNTSAENIDGLSMIVSSVGDNQAPVISLQEIHGGRVPAEASE